MRRRNRHTSRATAAPAPPAPTRGDWPLTVAIALALLALIALAYHPVRHFDFVTLDDPEYMSANPHLIGGLTGQNIWWAFTSRWASYWIPLTWVSYMAEVQLFGVQPGVHHVTNVLLHAANTLLLFTWLRRTTGAVGRSVFVAALFALHPLHVESVAWITERKDVLSTGFLLLALLAYTGYARQRTLGRGLTLCLLFTAGLMAKPMLVTLPFMLILCDVWPLERVALNVRTTEARARWRTVLLEKWPLFAIAAGASLIAYVTQGTHAMVGGDIFPLGLRVENALTSYVIYLRQMVWPTRLVVLYAYPESIPVWQAAGSAVLLVAASLAVLRWAAARPYLAMGWLWYVGTLVPVIGLVQVGLQPRADRFTYVPLIGIFIIMAWGASAVAARVGARTPVLIAAGAAITLACTVVSRDQVATWQDGVALWTHAVDNMAPVDAFQARYELGQALVARGQRREAIAQFVEAVRVRPTFTGAHAALGAALAADGRTADAQVEYVETLRLDPSFAEIHNNLGALLATEGKIADALPHFQDAVRLKPDIESAHVNLGVALARVGRRDDAIRELQAALRLNPTNTQARHVLDLLTTPGK